MILSPKVSVIWPTLGQNSPQYSTDVSDDDSPMRKRKGREGELLDLLKEAKAASQRRHDELL